jgi:uncharacterized protein (TIGR03382 family)
MLLLNRTARWGMMVAFAALLAISWVSSVLAQTDSDGDAFDGDEILSVPILLGMGVLAALAWSVYRRRSPKSQK